METIVASAALGGVSILRRPPIATTFSKVNRYVRGNSESLSLPCRGVPAPLVARKTKTRALLDFSKEQDSSFPESSVCHRIGRIAALFIGSSALLLAAGLSSCRTASAQEEIAGTVAATAERTDTVEKAEGDLNSNVVEEVESVRKEQEQEQEILDWLARVHEQMEKRNMPAAIKLLDKLIDSNPSQLEFRFIRGHAYEYIGDLDNALKEFEEVVKIQPLSVRGLQGLALVLKKQGKDIDFIQKTVEDAVAKTAEENKTAENITYRMLLAQILTLKDELPLALQHYEQLSKEDPTDFRPHLCQGLVWCILGDLDRAEDHFSNFEKHCPESYQGRDAMEDLIKNARAEAKGKLRS